MKTLTSTLTRALIVAVTLLTLSASAFAQTYTLNSTTLSAAVASTDSTVSLTSASAATNSSFGSVAVGQYLWVDQEFMQITAVSGTTATVQRRNRPTQHASGQTVYIGSGSAFQKIDPPIGVCTLANQGDPWINIISGDTWRCLSSQWLNVVDAYAFVGPGNCYYSTSGGTLTAQTGVGVTGNIGLGLVNAGTTPPGTPVIQIATTTAGTATNTISCLVPVPSRVNPSRGVYVADATWVYGVQQTGLGTQAVVLASGTLNGVAAFGKIVLPALGTSETPSTVAQARWDSGTMVLTPTAANFNVATTTAGAFVTQKIAPGAPVAMTTDLTSYYVNFSVLCTATSATTLNVAGVLIHYYTVTGL